MCSVRIWPAMWAPVVNFFPQCGHKNRYSPALSPCKSMWILEEIFLLQRNHCRQQYRRIYSLEACLCTKFFVADFTCEFLLAGVSDFVLIQGIYAIEDFRTNLAHVRSRWLLLFMCIGHMISSRFLRVEYHITFWAGKIFHLMTLHVKI